MRRSSNGVRHVLEELKPSRVLDIGANTGVFSALAAEQGAQVVALERDAAAAESLFRMTRNSKLPIQTIHADLSRPTPAVGWENHETSSLLDRLEAKSEMVLMLAVIHHLILMEQISDPRDPRFGASTDVAHPGAGMGCRCRTRCTKA